MESEKIDLMIELKKKKQAQEEKKKFGQEKKPLKPLSCMSEIR